MKTLPTITLLLLTLSLRAGTTVYSAPDETGLVGYWKMDEGGLTNVIDYSGNGNNGTNVGGATSTNGVVGGALSFNGLHTTDGTRISLSTSAPFTNMAAITIAAWCKLKQYDSVDGSFIFGFIPTAYNSPPGNPYEIISLGIQSSGNIFFAISSGASGSREILISGEVVTTNFWHFLAATYDGSIMKTYIDGTLNTNTQSASLTIATSNNTFPPIIGQLGIAGYIDAFNGLIDDVRIYNRALSATEITNLYNFRQTTYLTNGVTGYKL